MVELKGIIFGITIFILTLLAGIYGINTFYKTSPKYEDFCPDISSRKECIEKNGSWIDYNNSMIAQDNYNGYCRYDYEKCQKDYKKAKEEYSRGIFILSLPIGIIIIFIGAIFFGLASVGAGLMAGGLGILIFGTVGYWTYAKDYIKFALSLIGLVIIVILAYYANRKFIKK